MIILTIRTDKPESEIGLYDGDQQLAYETWQAHRQLAETIHHKLFHLLTTVKPSAGGPTPSKLGDVRGIVVYRGPGSFTGLRIGISVANALAYSLRIPIVGSDGDDWVLDGIAALAAGQNDTIVVPEYGKSVHITQPKK